MTIQAPNRYTSIIVTHWVMNELRSKIMKTSIDSLLETTKDLAVEIIVVNNSPENISDNEFFNDLVLRGKIVTYIINQSNVGFGFARNQGIKMAKGEYLCIADNDILYEPSWLEKCLETLETHPKKKIYATPIEYPTGFLKERYDSGKLMVGKMECNLNMRAGSNCFVIRRNDFDKIGTFLNHRVAGTKWTDKAVRAGYLAAVIPGRLVKDLGLRQGYNLGVSLPVKRTLRNGEEVYFNHDEYKIPNQ